MKRSVLLFFFAFILFFSINAQIRSDYRKKFVEGNRLLIEDNYFQALNSFVEAYNIDSSSANINYKVGLCYLKTATEKKKALPHLEKAVANVSKKYTDMEPAEKSAPVNAFYYYAQALHLSYKFDEAIANYETFKSFLSTRQVDLLKDVKRQIEISNNAKILVSAPLNVIIKNMGEGINSSYPDYSPLISVDEKTLIFTSRRPGSTGGDKTPEDQFYDDIYISYKENDSTWSTPVSISSNINTVTHEGSIGLLADGKTLLIYKDSNGGDIFYSKLEGDVWTVAEGLGTSVNTPNWETSACLTPDGNTLYFISDRAGGVGGRDIWKSTKLPNGNWSFAQNLGSPVNTPYDEESPYIHPSGNVLFFSSEGHQTIGGFDIFFSTKGDKDWDAPLNIGYPINTTDDDLYYVTSPDGKRGYYSSSSGNGFGEKDIYIINIPERKEQPLVLIKGTLIPATGEQLPPHIEIIATNNESGIVSGTYTPRDGNFTIIIPPNSNYNLSYQKDGEEFLNETMEVPADAAYQEIIKVINLKPFTQGQPISFVVNEEKPANKDTIVVVKKKEEKTILKTEPIVKTEPPVVKREQLAKVDKLNFQMFFKYNVTQTDVNDAPFTQFIDNLMGLYNKNGAINISMTSCASQVPTRAFKSNKELAVVRAEKTKEQLLSALKDKGIEAGKINFVKTKSIVAGPQYNTDYLISKAAYEKHQFVKINAY
ncbi:MAG: hypothetical protein ACT4ON_04285 [Bacteroidota bacterium]